MPCGPEQLCCEFLKRVSHLPAPFNKWILSCFLPLSQLNCQELGGFQPRTLSSGLALAKTFTVQVLP